MEIDRFQIIPDQVILDWIIPKDFVHSETGMLVGFLRLLKEKREILIEVNEERMVEHKARGARIAVFDNIGPMITLDSISFEKLYAKGNKDDLFILFHEVGHYMCGHFESPLSEEEVAMERVKCILSGEVWHEELEADRYAARMIGIQPAIDGLKQMMRESSQKDMDAGYFGDESWMLTMRDYMNRIKALESLA